MSWETSVFPSHSQGRCLHLPHQGPRAYTLPCSPPGQPKVPFLHMGPSIPATDWWIPHVSPSPQDQFHAGSRDGQCSLCFARCICSYSLQKSLHRLEEARCKASSPQPSCLLGALPYQQKCYQCSPVSNAKHATSAFASQTYFCLTHLP